MNYLSQLANISPKGKKYIQLADGIDYTYLLGSLSKGKPLPVNVKVDLTPKLQQTIFISVGILGVSAIAIAAIRK